MTWNHVAFCTLNLWQTFRDVFKVAFASVPFPPKRQGAVAGPAAMHGVVTTYRLCEYYTIIYIILYDIIILCYIISYYIALYYGIHNYI